MPPIHRLPPEVIAYIVRWVLEGGDVDGRSIVPLTHVCRYWRDSIVSTPENWALIYDERIKLAKLSLERAKAAPLTIHLNLGALKRRREFLELLLPHLQNAVSLTCVDCFDVGELVQLLGFPKSTPGLRTLSLTRPKYANHSQSTDPLDFSAHTTLRDLSLCNIPLLPSILSLRNLTKFSLFDHHFRLHIDILSNFLEENRSLESASLTVKFAKSSLCHPQRPTSVGNKLQYLLISSDDTRDIRALISSIILRRGGALEIHQSGTNADPTGIFSGVPLTHFPNLSSPLVMEYVPYPRSIRLLGPDGSFLFKGPANNVSPFGEFPLLPLANIRELRLKCCASWILRQFRLSSFPSLQLVALAVDGCSKVSLLPPMLADLASSPSLRTLAFLDCVITEDFMAQLTRTASNRTNKTSTSLDRVVIVNSEGDFPATASIEQLRKHVSVVEVLEGRGFPKDLS